MMSSLSRSLSSCCFVARPSAFHCRIRSVYRHWLCFGSETNRLVKSRAGAGAVSARHRGHALRPVLVTVLAASQERPEQVWR